MSRSEPDLLTGVLVNLDVDDIEKAIRFYVDGLSLRVGRRFDAGFVELLHGDMALYLLAKPPGSAPYRQASQMRDYSRHWTPIHLDFVVSDIGTAIERATAAGAQLESKISEHAYGSSRCCPTPSATAFASSSCAAAATASCRTSDEICVRPMQASIGR